MLLSHELQASLLASQGVTSESRTISNYATHLMTAGHGAASFVWFPALGESAVSFGPALVALAGKLAGNCNVVAVDPPGYGGSQLRDGKPWPTFGELAPWTGEVLTQIAGTGRRLVVAGNSSGGAIALGGVNRASDSVIAGLVFVSWPDWRYGQPPTASELCPVDVPALRQLLARSWHTPPPIPDSIAQLIIARLSSRAYYAHVASFDAREYVAELDRYRGPLAFVGGTSDRLVSPAVMEASAAAHAHRSVLRWMPDCGHYPHHEARDRFVDELAALTLKFLGELGDG
ncbi:MAG TPA: alpha/beta hydrolase [Kofleriaceae bacterium]